MAAQALCEPAPKDANKLFHYFKYSFISAISRHEISGICAINYLTPIDIFSHGIVGILILIVQHLERLHRG
jgi:hypothetical protein